MTILSAKEIYKSFLDNNENLNVLENVSLEITQGEMVAIIGPSGSGKTTLLNILGNVLIPDQGEIYIDGNATSQLKDKERCHLRNEYFGYIVQDFALLDDESVLENIMLPTLYHNKKIASSIYKERIHVMAEELQIVHKLKTKVKKLSGGEKQRVAIIRSQICNQQIILADEPTGALDQENTNIVMQFFQRLASQEKKSIIIVTHDLNVARKCNRVYQLKYGVLTLNNTLT